MTTGWGHRHFLPLADGRQLHYRRMGRGPALLMLHRATASSDSLATPASRLSRYFTCLALDLPGHGRSAPLSADAAIGADGYVRDIVAALDALGIAQAVFYGIGSGGRLAMAVAAFAPARVRSVIIDEIDGPLHLDSAGTPATSLPDPNPRRDGAHLLALWDVCRHEPLFSPWNAAELSGRDRIDAPSPETCQRRFNELKRVTPSAGHALATLSELRESRGGRPDCPIVRIDGAAPSSWDAPGIVAQFAALGAGAEARPAPPDHDPARRAVQNLYVDVPGGQVRTRGNLSGDGLPLLALHDPAGSSLLCEPMITPYVGDRPVLAIDMPGNGESDALGDTAGATSRDYAEPVIAVLDALGVSSVDVIGRYSGGPIALEMSLLRPSLVRHLVLAAIGMYEGEEQRLLLANYTPSIAPRWDGSHLMTAWSIMRDQALFWPWFNQTAEGALLDGRFDAGAIDLRVTEMLKAGDRYRDAYAAMWRYPMRDRLPLVKVPCLLAVAKWEPTYAKNADAARIARQCVVADLPARPADWRPVLDRFFTH